MFVSVIIESGSPDSGKFLVEILTQYGFQKIQRSCWEKLDVDEEILARLKKDLDRVTDYYDKIRFYQFPIDGKFVVTEMKQKKWRKCQFAAAAQTKSKK
jgi:CRISPR-associated protein Cas2